jgi:hypothetical protein
MSTFEHEFGAEVVIKLPKQPVIRVVAGATLVSQLPLVNVVGLMAVNACCRCV